MIQVFIYGIQAFSHSEDKTTNIKLLLVATIINLEQFLYLVVNGNNLIYYSLLRYIFIGTKTYQEFVPIPTPIIYRFIWIIFFDNKYWRSIFFIYHNVNLIEFITRTFFFLIHYLHKNKFTINRCISHHETTFVSIYINNLITNRVFVKNRSKIIRYKNMKLGNFTETFGNS